jgi:hypothetical protein
MKSKEIKVGTIVEVFANNGPEMHSEQVGQFGTVTKIGVVNGCVKYVLDKYKADSNDREMQFTSDEIRKVDFSKFFETRRTEILIESEITKASDHGK